MQFLYKNKGKINFKQKFVHPETLNAYVKEEQFVMFQKKIYR